MNYKIMITAILFMTFSCCLNKTSMQERFVEKYEHSDFSIFEDWQIEPREGDRSTDFLMRYVFPVISDTVNDAISMLVYAQIFSSDSNVYSITVNDFDKYRFCNKNDISLNNFNGYIDSVFVKFKKLNINSISAKKGVYKFRLKKDKLLLKYDESLSDVFLLRLDSLGYEKIASKWFYKSL